MIRLGARHSALTSTHSIRAMKLRLILLHLTSVVFAHDAHQAIFQSPASQHVHHSGLKHDYDEVLSRPLPRPRVAVIGGGAGGTSAAFFLHFLGQQEERLKVDVDLFEGVRAAMRLTRSTVDVICAGIILSDRSDETLISPLLSKRLSRWPKYGRLPVP